MMAPPAPIHRVVLDANVLYPASLRDLLRCAEKELYRLQLSQDIWTEVVQPRKSRIVAVCSDLAHHYQKEVAVAITHVFAGIPVADYDAALAWYERLLGRPPEVIVTDDEAMWQVAATAWIYVVGHSSRAGTALLTLLADDLEAYVAEFAERGLATGAIDTVPGVVRKAVISDPEGNRLTFGEDVSIAD